MENGIKSGRGTFQYLTGDVYEGEWRDDHPTGQGSFFFSTGEVIKGTWLGGGQLNGEGECVYRGGESYKGQYARGMKNG